MDKFLVLSALVLLLLGASVFQAFELNGLKEGLAKKTGFVSVASAAAAAPAAQSGGESYEQMMQRMHPDQFAQQQAQQASLPASAANPIANLPNMVGGC